MHFHFPKTTEVLRWLRDQFAAWFTGSFIMVAVFIAIMSSVGVGVIWDGYFARSLSPNDDLQRSFQVAGYVISAMAILSVSVGIKSCLDGARISGATFIMAGALAAIASWSQSIGVMSIAIEDKYEAVQAVEDQQEAVQTVNTAYLDELRAQRSAIEAKRDADIAQLEGTIRDIRDDGVDGVGSADLVEIARLQDQIAGIRTKADNDLEALNGDIKAELAINREAVKSVEPETVTSRQKFNPLFPLFASFRFGPNPTDQQIREVAVGFSVFWAALIPAFGMLLSVYLVITRHAANKRQSIQEEIEAKARRIAAARQGAQTRRENANTYDAEFQEPEPLKIAQPRFLSEDLEDDEDNEPPEDAGAASRRPAA